MFHGASPPPSCFEGVEFFWDRILINLISSTFFISFMKVFLSYSVRDCFGGGGGELGMLLPLGFGLFGETRDVVTAAGPCVDPCWIPRCGVPWLFSDITDSSFIKPGGS